MAVKVAPGAHPSNPALGGEILRKPTCTDCHQGHDWLDPRTADFRQQLSGRCGDCHVRLLEQYQMSLHGQLTQLGHAPAAKCADCHGWHEVQPVADPRSPVFAANRLQTCQKCHPEANANFANFDPHADHHDPQRSPLLHWVYTGLMTILLSVIGFFAVHSVLWLVRGTIQARRHPRPKGLQPGQIAYVRFNTFHRAAHVGLLTCFLGLAATGLPLKYSHTSSAQNLTIWLGGFTSMGLWHRIFGLVTFGYLVAYVLLVSYRLVARPKHSGSRTGMLFGPDSPIPNWRDVRDFYKMVWWFFGLGPKPGFERWSYWEKIDIWGALSDIMIIGLSGLVLWFPELVTTFMPGETLNVAKVIHSTQALLATGFVFAIHFFHTHVRPDKFPMDMSMFAGLVSDEELREERPDFMQRMDRDLRLEQLKATVPSQRVLRLYALGGSIGLAIGLALLAGIIIGLLSG